MGGFDVLEKVETRILRRDSFAIGSEIQNWRQRKCASKGLIHPLHTTQEFEVDKDFSQQLEKVAHIASSTETSSVQLKSSEL